MKIDGIFDLLTTYKMSRKWLDEHYEKLDQLEHRLINFKGNSIACVPESPSDESLRRSIANDKINEYRLSTIIEYVEHYERCKLCEQLVEQLTPQVKTLVKEIYFNGIPVTKVAKKYGYERTYIYTLIKKEVKKLEKENSSE